MMHGYPSTEFSTPRAAPLGLRRVGSGTSSQVSDLLLVDNGVIRECSFVTQGSGVEAHASYSPGYWGTWGTRAPSKTET